MSVPAPLPFAADAAFNRKDMASKMIQPLEKRQVGQRDYHHDVGPFSAEGSGVCKMKQGRTPVLWIGCIPLPLLPSFWTCSIREQMNQLETIYKLEHADGRGDTHNLKVILH